MYSSILFVCTGNTCRSSMAEIMAKHLLEEWKVEDVEVISAGVFAVPDETASSDAILALREAGLDLSEHRTKQLSADMIDKADIVLTMTRSHKNMVLSLLPVAEGKIFTLKEYTTQAGNPAEHDVSDPFGSDINVYRATAKELAGLVESALLKFCQR